MFFKPQSNRSRGDLAGFIKAKLVFSVVNAQLLHTSWPSSPCCLPSIWLNIFFRNRMCEKMQKNNLIPWSFDKVSGLIIERERGNYKPFFLFFGIYESLNTLFLSESLKRYVIALSWKFLKMRQHLYTLGDRELIKQREEALGAHKARSVDDPHQKMH